MVGDDLVRRKRGRFRRPRLHLFVHLRLEGGEVGIVVRAMLRIDGGEFIVNGFGDEFPVARIEPVVRIAVGMNVALQSGDFRGWFFEDVYVLRAIDDVQFRIAGTVNDAVRPLIELQTDFQVNVGAGNAHHIGRQDLDRVRIGGGTRDGQYSNVVAADGRRDRGQIGQRSHHFNFGERQLHGERQQQQGKQDVFFHGMTP